MKSLDAFFEAVNAREPEAKVEDILSSAEERFVSLSNQSQSGDLVQLLIDLESDVHADLDDIDAAYRVTRSGASVWTRQLQRDWDAYNLERNRLESEVFRPAATRLDSIVSQYATRMRADIVHRRRLDRALKDASKSQLQRAGSLQRETRGELDRFGNGFSPKRGRG